jgi:hypothetical protein
MTYSIKYIPPAKPRHGNIWAVVDNETGWTAWSFTSLKEAKLYLMNITK